MWIQPYASDVIQELRQGDKKEAGFLFLVYIRLPENDSGNRKRYAHLFKENGGEKLDLEPSLNDSNTFAEMIYKKINA